MWVTLAVGGIAGATAQTAAYPFDLLRRRYQVAGWKAGGATAAPKYTGIFDAFRPIVRDEGVRGLYKGLTPNYAKVVPTVAVSFAVYEHVKQLLGVSAAASAGKSVSTT